MNNFYNGVFKKNSGNFVFEVFDIVAFLVFVVGIMFFIRIFVFTPFSVVGLSMYPMFNDGDFILVDKISPKLGELKRGDIVVFVPEGKKIPYIKRIIGLPGEYIKIQSGSTIICNKDKSNCFKLDESYLSTGIKTIARCNKSEFSVYSGYFVMGDNRGNSTDSRCCFGYGCYSGDSNFVVRDKDILGKVFIRLFPSFSRDFVDLK